MKEIRKFDGKIYHLAGAVKSKKAIEEFRKRAKYGYVRSTPVHEGSKTSYALWVRQKK